MDNRHFGGPRPLPGCRPSFGDLEFSAAEINELLKRLIKMQDVEGLVSGVNIVNIENHELLQPGNLTLEDLGAARLENMNDVFVPWQGSAYATRNYLPALLRRKGISISYVTDKGLAVKERAVSDVGIDNANWGIDSNWMRVDELSLNGELYVSPNGTWVINGVDTGIQALGPKGDNGLTPRLKTIDNKLHYSYDGKEWVDAGGEHIAAWFRWSGNKIQISRDNKTWTDFSGEFADNLFIKGYVATFDKLPADAVQGDIWGVGPRYAAEDTENTNPIYRYWVRNAGSWVDNGEFTSIAAGIVQDTGDGEGVVMSQKAVTEKLAELESKVGDYVITDNIVHNVVNVNDVDYVLNKVINDVGVFYSDAYTGFVTTGFIPCKGGDCFRPAKAEKYQVWVCLFDKDKKAIPSLFINKTLDVIEIPKNRDVAFMRVSILASILNGCLYNSSLLINTTVDYNEVIIKADAIDSKQYLIVDDRLMSLEQYVKTNQIAILENLFDNTKITENSYINPSDGVIKPESTTFVTDYIPCDAGNQFVWQGATGSIICAFYDEDKQFIKGYNYNELSPFNPVPNLANVKYVRFSPSNSYKTKALYLSNEAVDVYVPFGIIALKIGNSILDIDKVSDLTSIGVIHNVNNISDSDYTPSRIIDSLGGFYSDIYDGWVTTGYIQCKKGNSYRIKDGKSFQWFACFFDKGKNAIAKLYENKSGDALIAPNNNDIAYVRISYLKSSIPDECIYLTDKVIPFSSKHSESTILANIVADKIYVNKLIANSINTPWQFACGRIVCIGDSLTDGWYASGSDKFKGYINENYPYYLSRMLNAEVLNAGTGGSHASLAYNTWYQSIDFSLYDSVLIWLGTNGGMDVADENAERRSPKYEGFYYRKLITDILAQNPSIKISLGTVFTTGEISDTIQKANVATTNAFILDVAEDFGLQVIDFAKLTIGTTLDLRDGIYDTHFGKAGNIYLANMICEEWEKWFNENPIRCEFGLTEKVKEMVI